MNQSVNIAVVGEYDPNHGTHVATNDALHHAAAALSLQVQPLWIATRAFRNTSAATTLQGCHGVLCAPGNYKNNNGAIQAIRFTREHGWPFLGT